MDLQNGGDVSTPLPPTAARSGPFRALSAMVALGVRLAGLSAGWKIGRFVAALTAACFVVAAFSVSRKGHPDVAIAARAAWSFAWGAGLLLAYSGAARAFTKDKADGLFFRVRASGVTTREYVVGRTCGLILTTSSVLLVAELLVVGASVAAARTVPSAAFFRSSAGALLYLLLFCVTMVPLAMSLLANRARARGYGLFLAVVLLPELLTHRSLRWVPGAWRRVLSIPDALEAVRQGVTDGTLAEVARGLLVLLLVTVLLAATLLRPRRDGMLGGL